MDVVVHHRHTLQAQRQRVRGRHRHVVIQTEPHRLVALRVMAWRANKRKDSRAAGLDGGIHAANRRSRRKQSHIPRIGRRERVGIQRHGTAGCAIDCRKMILGVNPKKLRARNGAGLS